MNELDIAFIGGGNMAEALIAGLLQAGHPAQNLWTADVSRQRLDYLQKSYGVHILPTNEEAASKSDVLVLAVKPQQMGKAVKGLGGHLKADATLISIAAGVAVKTLKSLLGEEAHLVRVMPNMPCLLGAGMSVLFSEAGEEHRNRAEYVLSSSGQTAWVDNEDMLHAVTAVSGSGPAYFFLLAEVMQAAAVSLGIPQELAGRLSSQTALGAGRMLAESGRSAAELRHQVTSPGGTTQAALEVMFEAGIPDHVRAAIVVAAKRSRDLA